MTSHDTSSSKNFYYYNTQLSRDIPDLILQASLNLHFVLFWPCFLLNNDLNPSEEETFFLIVEVQNEPPKDVPQWYRNYFELKTLWIQEKLLSPRTSSIIEKF